MLGTPLPGCLFVFWGGEALFWDRVSLYSLDCLGIHCAIQEWPWTHQICLTLPPSPGIKGVYHHSWWVCFLYPENSWNFTWLQRFWTLGVMESGVQMPVRELQNMLRASVFPRECCYLQWALIFSSNPRFAWFCCCFVFCFTLFRVAMFIGSGCSF